MTHPEITIAIPTHNRAHLLLGAVASALSQEYGDLEVLVSDNASDDGTEAALARLCDTRLRVFRHERKLSMSDHWNFCLKKARGRLFLLLSDDDVLLPAATARLRSAFENPDVRLAYARVFYVDAGGAPEGVSKAGPEMEPGSLFIKATLNRKRWVLPCATMNYTSEAARLGGYPDVGGAADLALRLGLAARGNVCCLTEPLAKYRMHQASLSADVDETIASMVRLAHWASVQVGPLSAWSGDVRTYCSFGLREKAVSCALRGVRTSAFKLLSAAEGITGGGGVYRLAISLCSSRPARVLAGLRRCLRKAVAVLQGRLT